jgi:hypothetical protein
VQKASQNQAYSATKLACETQKAATKLQCERVKSQLQTRYATQQAACQENKGYTLFIHAGPTPPAGLISAVTNALLEKGYTLRGDVESDQNTQYGPGVEYFDDASSVAADRIASVVNGVISKLEIRREESQKLKARRISANNPAGWLGVWLY